jgi:DNA replication protein DnaC
MSAAIPFCTAAEAASQQAIIDRLLVDLKLSDSRELEHQMRAAGWDWDRLCAESKAPDLHVRFAAAVRLGSVAEQERRIERQMKAILGSGPAALAGLSVEALAKLSKDQRLARLAREYEPQRDGGRVVCGPTSIGKSTTAAAIVRRRLQPKAPAAAQHWARAFDLPNARLGHGLGDGEAPAVERAIAADFLVLDDLGWESKRAGADDVVTEVIAARYDAGRITFATTGLHLDQLEARYSSAVVRRLLEAGGLKGKVIDCWPKEGGK